MNKLIAAILMVCLAPSVMAMQKKKKKTLDIQSVAIHHTVCFGQCPDYSIEITKEGVATYTAIRFNKDTGIFRKNIGKEKAAAIIGMCRKYRIDTCSEMYENRIPDLSGLIFTITYEKNRKQHIHSANFGPLFLREIAAEIDEAGKREDNSWEKIGMPKLE